MKIGGSSLKNVYCRFNYYRMNDFKTLKDVTIASLKEQSIKNKLKGDKYIWGVLIILAIISLLVVYSATGLLAYKINQGYNGVYLFKQISFIGVGIFVVYFLHKVPYIIYMKLSKILFLIAIPLLLYTLLFGAKINDGSRWIKLPIIHLTIQTSDFAKIALFMYLSRLLSKKKDCIKDFKKGFLPIITPVVIVCVLILPANLSNALLTGATSLLLMFIGRVSLKHILLTVMVVMIPIVFLVSYALITYHAPNQTTVDSESTVTFGRFHTWVKRIQDFVYSRDTEVPYQVQQAKMAIAGGGVFIGEGPGNSEQRNFLPQAYNDFIYSIIIEEYGLIGGGILAFIYLLFLLKSINIFKKSRYTFGGFLVLSLSFTLTIQAIVNMAVNVNILPVTGVTLPLVSMGGSSFLFTCVAIGIILSVSTSIENVAIEQRKQMKEKECANTVPISSV